MLRRLRDIASRARQSALQHGPFGGVDVVTLALRASHDVGRGPRPGERLSVDAERQPRRPRRAHDEIVTVYGQQRRPEAFACAGQQDARQRKSKAEILGFDCARGVRHRGREQLCEALSQIGPARGDIERRCEFAAFVVNRRRRAGEERIAGEEMLVAIDRHRALLVEAGSDAVGALEFLAPDGAGPEPPPFESRVVARRPAPLDDDAIPVGEQDRAADAADRRDQPIEGRMGDAQQPMQPFARARYFRLG